MPPNILAARAALINWIVKLLSKTSFRKTEGDGGGPVNFYAARELDFIMGHLAISVQAKVTFTYGLDHTSNKKRTLNNFPVFWLIIIEQHL
jgi:hypothetical protein